MLRCWLNFSLRFFFLSAGSTTWNEKKAILFIKSSLIFFIAFYATLFAAKSKLLLGKLFLVHPNAEWAIKKIRFSATWDPFITSNSGDSTDTEISPQIWPNRVEIWAQDRKIIEKRLLWSLRSSMAKAIFYHLCLNEL